MHVLCILKKSAQPTDWAEAGTTYEVPATSRVLANNTFKPCLEEEADQVNNTQSKRC